MIKGGETVKKIIREFSWLFPGIASAYCIGKAIYAVALREAPSAGYLGAIGIFGLLITIYCIVNGPGKEQKH